MISSIFVANILDLLLDFDKAGKALRPQVDYLVDVKYEYTGSGLFVTFQCSPGIEKYTYPEGDVVLDGVTITSPELEIGASATIFTNGGLISTLEIWSFDGEYPKNELGTYTLKQDEKFGTGRVINR